MSTMAAVYAPNIAYLLQISSYSYVYSTDFPISIELLFIVFFTFFSIFFLFFFTFLHFPAFSAFISIRQNQVGSAVLLGLGIWTLADRSFMNELLGTNLFSGTVYVLIGTAAFVCVISFFGCYGAAKEVKSLLLFVSENKVIVIFRQNNIPI